MTEEKTTEIIKETECRCFCKSEGFRNFLVTALGTFIGVYMALSLFTAIHKPPMPCPCHFGYGAQIHKHFGPRGDFKKIDKKLYKEFKDKIKEERELKKSDIDD